MDNHIFRPMLEDTLTPKSPPTQTFFPMKEIGKHITKVANSSTSSMTSIKELPSLKPGKINTP